MEPHLTCGAASGAASLKITNAPEQTIPPILMDTFQAVWNQVMNKDLMQEIPD